MTKIHTTHFSRWPYYTKLSFKNLCNKCKHNQYGI